MTKTFLALIMAGMTVAVGSAAPAWADDTTTTVTVNSSDLTISVPATADLGSASPGDTASGNLGAVTVTDQRALLSASWVASVVATDFTTGGATPAETIPNTDVSYWSGPATSTTGNDTFTPGQPTAADAAGINVPRTAFTLEGGTGNNSASWDPTVEVAIPAGAVAGEYTGTVTHSVL